MQGEINMESKFRNALIKNAKKQLIRKGRTPEKTSSSGQNEITWIKTHALGKQATVRVNSRYGKKLENGTESYRLVELELTLEDSIAKTFLTKMVPEENNWIVQKSH